MTGQQGALVVGEALVDVLVRAGRVDPRPGGSAANTAVALARLGRSVSLLTCLADDAHGALVRAHLASSGVTLVGDPVTVARTPTATAHLDADGAATYEFDLAWRPADPGDVAPLVVHAGSIGAVLEPGAGLVADLLARLRATATVSYDVNARPVLTGTGPDVVARVERLVVLSDVVKASDEDLAALWPERSIAESVAALLALGPACVVVTRGRDGASFAAATGEGRVAPVPTTVEDTVGAGDTFSAGILDGLWARDLLGAHRRAALRSEPASVWHDVLGHAARAAAVTVSRPGADPPWRHELAGGAP